MRLSEAILLGSTIRPQTFGRVFDTHGSCAFGAALEAAGAKYQPEGLSTADEFLNYDVRKLWTWLVNSSEPCPDCGKVAGFGTREVIAAHLNDAHRWSRERIAEWVSTIEPPEKVADAAVTREREAEAVENAQ
jgi:hypothetical protein